MTSVQIAANDSFAREFDEYRRACRTRFQEQKPVFENEEPDLENANDDLEDHDEQVPTPTISASSSTPVQCTTTAISPNTDKTPVAALKKESKPRRNSFSKFVSYFSNVLKTSPPPTAQEKEKAKMARKKKQQDANMAHLIAQLEFDGKSDEEIQMHLFHLRDIANQPKPPKGSMFSEMFRDMSQAFKDEFSMRRGNQCMTVSVSAVNPFTAAMPANYAHDSGYSYEDLVRLEPVPRGLQSTEHLPTLVYEGQELPSDQTTCAVCMAEFETSEELTALACTHHFHKECIDKWLGVAPSCPVCKGEVSSA